MKLYTSCTQLHTNRCTIGWTGVHCPGEASLDSPDFRPRKKKRGDASLQFVCRLLTHVYYIITAFMMARLRPLNKSYWTTDKRSMHAWPCIHRNGMIMCHKESKCWQCGIECHSINHRCISCSSQSVTVPSWTKYVHVLFHRVACMLNIQTHPVSLIFICSFYIREVHGRIPSTQNLLRMHGIHSTFVNDCY